MSTVLATGIGASPGVARGRARIITARGSDDVFAPGDVLVAVVTDPIAFTHIIEDAVAVVTDLGGITSHAAMLCRELGLPCVVGAESATSAIEPGTEVVVDGTTGTVYLAN